MNTTSCDEARQVLLDQALDEAERGRMFAALQHVDGCGGCQEALRDFDRIRGVLAAQVIDAEPLGGWDAFEQQLTRGRVRRVPQLPHWWFSIAASVLIGAVMFVAGRGVRPSPVEVAPPAPAVARPSQVLQAATFAPEDLPPKVAFFEKVIKQFNGQASWVMLSKDATDMGTSPEPLGQTTRLLLLRLTITRQNVEVSDADVLIVPGQTADVNVPLAQGQSVHYVIHTSKDDPAGLCVWLEMLTPDDRQETLAALRTNLHVKPGESLSAGHLATSAGEYVLKIGCAEASAGGERS